MASRLFDVRPAALARIPLLPASAGQSMPGTDPLLREAVFLASRQIGESAEKASAGNSRASATIRGYELRARWRPTPNGAFAAAAAVLIGGKGAVLRLGDEHRACTVPSGSWLASVAGRLAEDPAVLDRLRLITADLAARRGQRFEIERPAVPGEAGPQRASVNATAATDLILRECSSGHDVRSLAARVRKTWPAVPEATIRTVLAGLVRNSLLVTDLLPADLWDDPLGHVLGRLPAGYPGREALERLRSLLAEADRHRPGDPARLAALRTARQKADEVCVQQRPLSVNVIADARLKLPQSVAEAAADAATVLWRIGDHGDPLAGYHRRFAERYGRWRLVPFSEMCDPVLGLGTAPEPAGEDGTHRPGRVQALARLIARAATTGTVSVVLDDADITALSHGPWPPPPRTGELWARVLAATRADRDAGRFFLAVSGCSQDAGSTGGRFAGLRPFLPADPGEEGTLVAELVVAARMPQAAPLAPPAGLAPCRIPVGVAPRDGDLRLADLHVFSDGDRLIVWSAAHGKPVVPVLYSRLSADMLPPQARLLQLLGRSGCRPFQGWSWGAMRHCPFQPRVLYQHTVLSPARWLLPPDLIAAARDRARWPQAVNAWQAETVPSPPGIVVIEDGDRLLPLDLQVDDDRELLRRHVGRGARSVTEQPGGPDAIQAVLTGPAGDHMLELILSLDLRRPSRALAKPLPARPAGTAGLYLPGGEWLSLTLRAPEHVHDQLVMSLGEAVASILEGAGRWFWLRYADATAGPQLRARFHGDATVLGGRVLPALSAWCRIAIQQQLCGGFSVDPYDQEIERYGGPAAITAAEDAFAADSRLALAVLQATANPGQRMIAAALLAATIAGTVAPNGAVQAIGRARLDRAARTRYEELRPQARASKPLQDTPITEASRPAWTAWKESLVAYRDVLNDGQRALCASSLIHMSANRLLGSLTGERIARALAADILARTTRVEVLA